MSQIKISVPHYDHVALRAMAKALEEIAAARAEEEGVEERLNHYNINIDTAQPGLSAARLRECANYLEPVAEVDTAGQQYESLNLDGRDVDKTAEMVRKVAPVVTTTDSTGTPWDERIHSASKALNSDGTWRVRRKPKDMDEAEWSATIQNVQDELLGEKPESDEYTVEDTEEWEKTKQPDYLPEPSVTPPGDDFYVDTGAVTEQEVAAIPAPPPPPVVTALAQGMERYGDAMSKLAENDGAPVNYTFPQVMQFLTERHGRITSPQVDQIIADMGLDSIMSIRDNPEHAGPFIARVKALLGE